MTRVEQKRELELVHFMEEVYQFCASMKVRMCRPSEHENGCNLSNKVLNLDEALKVMSKAHVAVMRERSLPRHKAGVDVGTSRYDEAGVDMS